MNGEVPFNPTQPTQPTYPTRIGSRALCRVCRLCQVCRVKRTLSNDPAAEPVSALNQGASKQMEGQRIDRPRSRPAARVPALSVSSRHRRGAHEGDVLRAPRAGMPDAQPTTKGDNNMSQAAENDTASFVPGPLDFALCGSWINAMIDIDGEILTEYFNEWSEDPKKLFRVMVALGETLVQTTGLRQNPEVLKQFRSESTDYLACSQVPGMDPRLWVTLSPEAKAALLQQQTDNRKENNDNE